MKSNQFLGRLKSMGKNVDWLESQMTKNGEQVSRSAIYKKPLMLRKLRTLKMPPKLKKPLMLRKLRTLKMPPKLKKPPKRVIFIQQ